MKTKNLNDNVFYFLISILTLAVIFLFLLSMSLQGEIVNKDKPEKGTGNFNMKELWQVSEGGENPFGNIRSILISEDGILCCLDDKLNQMFLYDKDGKFLKGFSKKGEGPGEIKLFRQAGLLNAGKFIAVRDSDRIHYFNWEGEYLESFPNPRPRAPILFLSRYVFITAPQNILAAPKGIAEVKKVNLKTGEESLITKFSMYKGGTIANRNSQASIIANGLTPMFELGLYKDRLYYGVSDKYRIEISNMNGKALSGFGVTREKSKVTEEEKVRPILQGAKGLAPEELLRTLAKKLPNEETYFVDIQSHNGQIWIFVTDWKRGPSKQIDIFSPDGNYLYRRFVKIDPEESITSGLIVHGDSMYLVIRDAEDEFRVAKYSIDLPK